MRPHVIVLSCLLVIGVPAAVLVDATDEVLVSYYSPENGLILRESYIRTRLFHQNWRWRTTHREYLETGYSWFLVGYPDLEDLDTEFRVMYPGDGPFPLDPMGHHFVFAFLIQQSDRDLLREEIRHYLQDRRSPEAIQFRENLSERFNEWLDEVDVVERYQDLFRRWTLHPDQLQPRDDQPQ